MDEGFSNMAIDKQVGHRRLGKILVCYLTIICLKKLVKLQCDKNTMMGEMVLCYFISTLVVSQNNQLDFFYPIGLLMASLGNVQVQLIFSLLSSSG